MKVILLRVVTYPLNIYIRFVSPLIGPSCRFYPTCSTYTRQALEKHGIIKGLCLGTWRILRCHPWGGKHGHDPVPEEFSLSGGRRFAWGHLFGYKRRH